MAGTSITMSGFKEATRVLEMDAPKIISEESIWLADDFGRETVKTAQDFLNKYVYDLPEPEKYHRTGRTFNAIKYEVTSEGTYGVTAKAFVDESDFNFPYFLTLEYGTGNWYWWGVPAGRMTQGAVYEPRPFWRSTKAAMREKFLGEEEKMLTRITTRINTRFA